MYIEKLFKKVVTYI